MLASRHRVPPSLRCPPMARAQLTPRYSSWEQYLLEAVLKPLGMSDTGNPSDYLAGTGARARLVDGVDPPTAGPVPVAMKVSVQRTGVMTHP